MAVTIQWTGLLDWTTGLTDTASGCSLHEDIVSSSWMHPACMDMSLHGCISVPGASCINCQHAAYSWMYSA